VVQDLVVHLLLHSVVQDGDGALGENLFAACAEGDVRSVFDLVLRGVNVNFRSSRVGLK
jgi:hypothetical protein